MDDPAKVREPPAEQPTGEPRAFRVLAEVLALLVAGGVWTALTGASLTFDATPVPGDGTLFGELAGLVAAGIGWRIVVLLGRLRKRVR